MIDLVTRELEWRAVQQWPWRLALALSLVVHIAAGVALLLAGSSPRRPTTLPSVQVRLTAMPLPAPASSSAPPAAQARPAASSPAPRRPVSPPAPPASRPAPQRPAPSAAARPTVAPVAAPEPAAASPSSEDPTGDSRPAATGSSSGGLTLGGGSRGAGTDEVFPYDYYLQRLLGLIESNWFRPQAPATTRCRVRARLDRSGRLLEAGISEESGMPAFDRAALRAVFAAAPFPPLPQGFGGTTLTIHLEFGQ